MGRLVAIGSLNLSKVAAAQVLRGYGDFDFEPVHVKSLLPEQPVGDHFIHAGAATRAQLALQQVPTATYGLGIEQGIVLDGEGDAFVTAWACIMHRNLELQGFGSSGRFAIPHSLRRRVLNKKSFGRALDEYFDRERTEDYEGSVGLLTRGGMQRSQFYAHAVHLAYIPFLNEPLYFEK